MHSIVIVGGGAAGIAAASSLLARQPGLDVLLVEPADNHFYQPGWTLVGAGVSEPGRTRRTMQSVMPRGTKWLKAAVTAFDPAANQVILGSGRTVKYEQLVVCPGLSLDWSAVEGLAEALGRNGVTSNYRYDLAPYTWELTKSMQGGKAIFTQPPLPIKCTGAPQKAMYLSADHWRRESVLASIDIDFCTAGAALFSVPDYVPALEQSVASYGIHVKFGETLVAVDGSARTATFAVNRADGSQQRVVREFDMLHVVPPQKSPEFVRTSPLADAAGWLDIDSATLRHRRYANVYGLGDVSGTSNSKTAAAVRRQAPVVAVNLLRDRGASGTGVEYDGYSSCPITVERGKVVLAEFTYGGKLAPTFPKWLIDGRKPSALAWHLKEQFLPWLYWRGMLKGREWLAAPRPTAS